MKNKLLVCFGLLCAFYPFASRLINSALMRDTLATFARQNEEMDGQAKKDRRKRMEAYNASFDETVYGQIEEEGIVARITIPAIGLDLPVYAGCGEDVLARGAGHWPASALPLGRKGERPVLTGHRGLAGHGLFTRLDELKKGDVIRIDSLDETLWYEVRDTSVLLPEEAQEIGPVEEMDMITLITCTPYGINTHRLVVDALRCGAPQDAKTAQRMPSARTAVLTLIPFGLLISAMIAWKGKWKCGKN